MKRVLTVLFAGALFATAAFSDSGAHERFRMKNGRDFPAVEKAQDTAAALARERAGNAVEEGAAVVPHNDEQERYLLKMGRYTPQQQALLEERGLTPGPVNFSTAAPAHNDWAERYHLKTGRYLPGYEATLISEAVAPVGAGFGQ